MYKQKIEIKYNKSYISKSCRKPKYEEVTEKHEIPIAEASKAELKKVFTVDYCDKYDIFSYKGSLWRLATERDIRVPEDNDNLVDPLPLFLDRTRYSVYYGRYENCTDESTRETKEQILKRAKKNVSDFMIVGKTLYIRVQEPYYTIHTFGLGNNHGGTGLMVELGKPNTNFSRTFTALEWDKAVNKAIQIAAKRGDTEDVARFTKYKEANNKMIVVYDKTAVKLDLSEFEVGFAHLEHDIQRYLIQQLAGVWSKQILEMGCLPKPKTNLMKAYKSWEAKHLNYTDDLDEYIVAYCYNQLVAVLRKERYFPDGSKVGV